MAKKNTAKKQKVKEVAKVPVKAPAKVQAKKEIKPVVKVLDQKVSKPLTPADKAVKAKKVVVTKPAPAPAKTPAKKVVAATAKKTTPVVKATPAPAPKPTTRPAGYVFTITKEDVGPDGKRRLLAHLPNDVVVSEGFTLQRSADAMFLIDIMMPGGTKQAMPRPMGSTANADALFKELVDMENNRGAQPIQKAGSRKQEAGNNKEGVLTNEVDINALIHNLPKDQADQIRMLNLKHPVSVNAPGNTPHKAAPFIIPPTMGGMDTPPVITDHKIALPAYAKSLEETLYDSFSMRMRSEISGLDLKNVLANCLKCYAYEIVKEEAGHYVTITHNETVMRVPADKSKFIVIV